MSNPKFTKAEVDRILDGRLHSPIQDVVGDNYTSGSPLAMSADTEYDFVCNGATRNFKSFPESITNMWNTTTNITELSEVDDTEMIVATVSFTFDPSVSAAGIITLQPYANEDTPIPFKTRIVSYKGNAERVSADVFFYAGSETGFDIKNKGVFFKVESTGAGNLYDTTLEIYRT